jgi:hypothetical protein
MSASAASFSALNLPRLVGPAAWSRLPPAVQRRFAPGHTDAVYQGHMDLHCSAMGRCFAWFARPLGSPLTSARAANVSTTVTVATGADGGVVWERCFEQGVGRVRSTKELDAEGGLQERTDGGLTMSLAVFEEGGALVFESRRYFLVWGRWRLPVAAWMSPGVCRVEHHDLGQGRFRFTLSMNHPWLGETFSQTGIFVDPR